MSDTTIIGNRDSDHFNNPNPVIHCAPDALIGVTFGSASKKSIVARLVADEQERTELLHGQGRYSEMRKHPGIRNDEMYAYLRLGVSSHCAVAFQALGYPTAKSLTESSLVSGMLPDALVREDREYPLEFIDRCERDGIAALECQAALRRGITTIHLDGKLNTEQLIQTMNRYVRREGLGLNVNERLKTVIDYFVDGTLPLELQEGHIPPENMVAVVRYLLKNDPEFLEHLRNDVPVFHKFLKATRTGIKNGVEELRTLVLKYGDDVLDLHNPYLCANAFHDADGTKRKVGLELVQYIESIVRTIRGEYALWGIKASDENVEISGLQLRLVDLEVMLRLGITADEVNDLIFGSGMTPAAVIGSKREGIQRPLMHGVL